MSHDLSILTRLARVHGGDDGSAAREKAEPVAAKLRERFASHPKQRAFWQSTAKRSLALCTRRAGKSDGGVREWLARAITTAGWRGVYVNETKGEARKIVWSNDLGQGWIDLLAVHGTPDGDGYQIGGLYAKPNGTLLTIDFSNGSQIALFGADDLAAINKLRGQAKDEIWVDEAQKFLHLRAFVLQVAGACLMGEIQGRAGQLRLTGTPSEDCAGYFYDCCPEPESGDSPLPGWEVHRWSVVDNPGFGATEQERWDRTAGAALTENGWDGTEPDFLREWLGKWVKSDARFVYPVHAVPPHELVYAPQRLTANTFRPQDPDWYDHTEAFLDLPRLANRRYQWLYAIGVDFGYHPDPFAIVVWAFNHELQDVWEMFSWKATRVHTDDQGAYLKLIWDALDNVVVFVGDPAGKQDDFEVWRTRMNLPLDEANKKGRATLEDFLAGDIRKGRVHFRADSPLLTEMRHLVYLPTKPGKPREVHKYRRTSDGKVHSDNCVDASRYSYCALTHYLSVPRQERAPRGTEQALIEDEAKHEAAIDKRDRWTLSAEEEAGEW